MQHNITELGRYAWWKVKCHTYITLKGIKLPLAQFVKVKVKAQKLGTEEQCHKSTWSVIVVSNYGKSFISWFWDDDDDGYDVI